MGGLGECYNCKIPLREYEIYHWSIEGMLRQICEGCWRSMPMPPLKNCTECGKRISRMKPHTKCIWCRREGGEQIEVVTL